MQREENVGPDLFTKLDFSPQTSHQRCLWGGGARVKGWELVPGGPGQLASSSSGLFWFVLGYFIMLRLTLGPNQPY